MANNPGNAALGQSFQTSPVDMGKYLYAGLASAGGSVGDAIKTVTGLKMARDAAADTLDAMHTNGTISDKDYMAVAGKSFTAQQAMIGQYASIAHSNLETQQKAGLQTNEGQVTQATQAAATAAAGAQERQTQAAQVGNAITLFNQTKVMPPVNAPAPAPSPQTNPNAQPTQNSFRQRKMGSGYVKYQVDPKTGQMVGQPQMSPTQDPNVPLD